MDILITGNISTIALSLVKQLLEEGHHVVVTNASNDFTAIKSKNFAAYKMNTSDVLYQKIYQSHDFDTVCFISALEDDVIDTGSHETTQPNIGLENTLDLCQKTGVSRFIFISSTGVYGNSAIALENEQPEPSSNLGQMRLNGENLCRYYAKTHALSISIVRVPYIYGPQEKTLFYTSSLKL